MIRTEFTRTQETFAPESKIMIGLVLATASCSASSDFTIDESLSLEPTSFIRSPTVELSTPSFGSSVMSSSQWSDEHWQDYADQFSVAIGQLEAGELIPVPGGIRSEDEFFEWLKSV